MIKLKMMAVACAVMSFVFCTGVVGRVWGQDISDSPINIGGGSIYGKLKDPKSGWTIDSAKKVRAQSYNIGTILTKDIENVPKQVQVPNGWVIALSNKKKQDGSEHPNAVLICSDAKCKGKALDPNQTIYLRTRSGSRWTVRGDGSLHFHDNDCDGVAGTTEDKACDYLVRVRIQSPKGKDVANGNGICIKGECQIGIGTPPPKRPQ